MKWTREEYINLMTFGNINRPMFSELFGLLIGLPEEWKTQGATEEMLDLSYFDFDYVPRQSCGINCHTINGFKNEIIEDNSEYRISRDIYGRRTKLVKKSATTPLPLDYPVTDMDSWLKIKHMFLFDKSRINFDALEAAKKAQAQGVLISEDIFGGFDLVRELMGEENCCVCYYEDPELMHDIISTIQDTTVKTLDIASQHIVIDNVSIHEDMAGKSGPLVGPAIIKEFIKPYYKAVVELLSARGTKLFAQDSDGNMNSVIDAFLDCGVNLMFPAEPAAGMDIVSIRKQYGEKLALKGGIDKHVLRQDKTAIIKELEYKLQPGVRKGTVFGLDHRITNGTPLENYKFYVKTAKEILGIPSTFESRGKHSRMAF